jgi:hypothetical protein
MPSALAFLTLFISALSLAADSLRPVGSLGNSGEVRFAEKTARGMGPVIDAEGTIWERGGANQLNRYSPDGRMLASFEIPEGGGSGANDQLTLAGDLLLLNLSGRLLSFKLSNFVFNELPRAEILSSSSFKGRVVIFSEKTLSWLDPVTDKKQAITKITYHVDAIHLTEDGIVHIFGGGLVHAWKDAKPLPGFPKGFKGERPRKIGDHWYSHAWHGTINRLDAKFQPDPGVVLGGASGSFIGFLPQSADLDNGRGMVQVRDGLFAVSGMGGVVQFLSWNGNEQRFKIVRRLGALTGISGVALDETGQIWTTRGSWRWSDGPEVPATIGDKEAGISAQPTVLDGKILCVVKTHYSDTRLAHGPLIDANGWSHFEWNTIKDFKLSPDVTGSAAITHEGRRSLVIVERGGKGFEIGISNTGQLASNLVEIKLPGLQNCTSLAWFKGQLLAADQGKILAFESIRSRQWKPLGEVANYGGEIHIASDGKRLAISERDAGKVYLINSIGKDETKASGLQSPTHVAVSENRLVVYEEGGQQLTKFELGSPPKSSNFTDAKIEADLESPARFTEADYQSLSRPGGIPLSVAFSPGKNNMTVSVRSAGDLVIGVANQGNISYFNKSPGDEQETMTFVVPGKDWGAFRFVAMATLPMQQERFGFIDHKPIHASLSQDPNTWAIFDLAAYREAVTARKKEIRLTFTQAKEGKASLVIEDSKTGARIRNLVSGRRFAAGKHTVVWDGLDEQGRLVAPGSYAWRGITHPGITPDYRMSFADGREPSPIRWGPNHSTLQDASSNGEFLFFAAPVTEGGWALMALDRDGKFLQGYDHQHGYGIQKDAIAADEKYLYCAQDGFTWGDPGARGDGPSEWTLTVVRYEIASGKLVEFPGGKRALKIDRMKVGPGSDHPNLREYNLAGLAVSDGKLYVGSQNLEAVVVHDAGTGERIRTIPMKGLRHLAAGFAATDSGVFRLGDGKEIISTGGMEISGIAISESGEFFLSDRSSHQVHRFSKDGKKTGTIGKSGGPYEGSYDPGRMVNPAGLTLGPDGKLWVTEDRWNPKRILAWDLKKNEVVYEKFGMPHYGGDGSGFDPQDPRRWIGLGCFWDVDLERDIARPTHIISLEEGHFGKYHPQSYLFFRENGRTFLCSRGKIAVISEVRNDGTIRDLAAISGTHHFAYGCDWDPPQAYLDAFYEKWPEKKAQEIPGAKSDRQPWAKRGMGVLWVDQNGDGKTQENEFDFCGDQLMFADGAWGHLQTSLTLEVPVVIDGQVKILSLAPDGFLPNGIPKYPTLDEAIDRGRSVSLTPGDKRSGVATVRDRHDRFIFNSDPEMNAYAADGRHLWTYPNQWSNVHGSHDAPLPEPGVMQGTLAFLGCAPLDESSDVIFLNGNHGRCFLMSTDGIYLDEAFVDVRVSYLDNEYRLGGEIFGGSFARSEKDGKYYVQIGHGPYRIYQLHGLDQIRRISGTLEVTPQQIASAEQQSKQRVAKTQATQSATLPGTIKWDKNGQFKAELKLSHDATHLHLHYRVEDRSPWVNNGRDWTKLFASGDSVDIQIATDREANPSRRGPAPGDKRLLIAPFENETMAVLYEHRKEDGKNNPIEFTSPWRAETVDDVRRIEQANIETTVEGNGYAITASIPLADLGFTPKPGQSYRADFGVTFGNAEGTDTNLRSYWSNQSTGLVDDIPGEIMLSPNLWGELRIRE